ncbi:MAG: extracellular solute-binding protein [Firmicutes bacterium]|nr:extracellular solute-binding protein [Bacillota bacterium]
MRKSIGIFLSLILSVSMLFGAGCVRVENPLTDDEEREEVMKIIEGVDLDAGSDYEGSLSVYYEDSPSEVKIMDAFLSAFQEAYPNIEITKMPTVTSNYQRLIEMRHSTAYNSQRFDTMPDIIWTTNEILADWVDKRMLMPVNYFDERDSGFSAQDTFVSSMLEDSMLGESTYMYPRDYNQFVMYYNRKLLNLAGIPESRIPSDRALTHDEFDQLLRDIRAAFEKMGDDEINPENNRAYNGVRALDAVWAWGSLCWPTLKSFGGSVVNENGEVDFNNEENIAAATYLRELIKDKLTFGTGSSMHAQFTNQMTVLCIETRSVLTNLIDRSNSNLLAVKPEDLGVAPMPSVGNDDNYAIGSGCSGYAMYRYAQHPTEAWLFLKFMASEAGQNAFCDSGNGIPSNKNLLTKADAVWRNPSAAEVQGLVNFNQDAFIYQWDESACTLQDFKKNISKLQARQSVSTRMTKVLEACLNTSDSNYEDAIKEEFSEGEKAINRIIQSATK